MPTVIVGAALSAVAAGSAITAAGVLSIGFSLSTFAGSLILGGLSYALTPKPKSATQTAQEATVSTSTVAVRQSDLTRPHVRGHTRITRGYAHMESTGVNGYLHCVLILCEGPLRAINEIWVNDYCIPQDWIDENGNVTQGRYQGYLQIFKHLGTADQEADAEAIENLEDWSSTDTLSGIAYLYLIMKKNTDVYPSGVPNITAIVEGPALYDPRTEEETWSTNIALYARDYITNTEYGYGAREADIDDDNISAQANICDEIVPVTEEAYITSAIDTSTNIITLEGDILSLCFGDRVRIQSTGAYPEGTDSGSHYYVIPYQVKDTPRILLASSLENAMAKTAIDITSAGSGTITIYRTGEPRYHGSGIIETEKALNENLNDIATAAAGRTIETAGFWTVLVGAWRTPAVSLGINDMAGEIAMKRGIPMSEHYNAIKGVFVSPRSFYQKTDYPSLVYDSLVEQDGLTAPIYKEMNLAFLDRPTAAQRVAKIELLRSRQDISFKNSFVGDGLRLTPGDNTELTIDKYGFDDKYFEITEAAFEIVDGAIISRLSMRETAEEIFDWDGSEAITFDPAPNTTLPDPFSVTVVSGFGLDSVLISTQGGDYVFNVFASWELHENQFVVNNGKYEISYKETTESVYKSAGVVTGDITEMRIHGLKPDVLYDIQIIAYNSLGVGSTPNIINNFQVGTTVTTETEDWENETLDRDGDDWESDTLTSEDWES